MPPKFAVGLSACCVAVAIFLATAQAADQKPSLMGATRDQVLQRYGEPKSQMIAGSREIMFFARERVVFRNGVVVEVELLPAELPPRRAPVVAPPPPTAAAPASAAAPAPTATPAQAAPAAAVPVAAPVAAPAAAAVPSPAAVPVAQAAATPTIAPDTSGAAPTVQSTTPAPPPPPEPQLAIKFVRPPSAGGSRPVSRTDGALPPATPAPDAPAAPPAQAVEPMPQPEVTPAPVTPPARPAVVPTKAPTAASTLAPASEVMKPKPETETVSAPETVEPPPTIEPSATPPAEKKARGRTRKSLRRLDESDFPEPVESIFTTRTYLIAFLVIGGGAAYLIWRYRQRQLELAATAVSRVPFSGPTPTGSAAMFDANLLGKLEWKRFEELVASYYSKTGVVAVRTKTGPSSPVQVKISWKGEPRPFACVQCIAHPPGLIDAKPIQELFAVLAAEDIRRGYVVTTGKFSIPARDFAEEKHLTLLSGDLFLEKLNALPDSARAELMEEITTGDFTTPSCPLCDAKATRSSDDSSVWRCKSHPDVEIPARK